MRKKPKVPKTPKMNTASLTDLLTDVLPLPLELVRMIAETVVPKRKPWVKTDYITFCEETRPGLRDAGLKGKDLQTEISRLWATSGRKRKRRVWVRSTPNGDVEWVWE